MTLWRKILNILSFGRRGGSCHEEELHIKNDNISRKVSIVGSPNVGKSVVFNSLTGAYVTISKYPRTTVNVSRGKAMTTNQMLFFIFASF